MKSREDYLAQISAIVNEYFNNNKAEFIRGKSKISLQAPSYGPEEATEVIESLLSTWVTMGKKVAKFEEAFGSYVGAEHSVMTNSGSSANLLALSVLTNPKSKKQIEHGSEVITPAVTWVTTVYPIVNVGLKPVIVDVDLDTFNINVDAIEKSITKKTKAIMPVHLLGNPADMKSIMEIAKKHGLIVLEDSCEAHGAEVMGKKVGSIGDIGTFSFFYSHHISTVEGGMILTSDDHIFELCKAMRAFGWIRDLAEKDKLARSHPTLDSRFLFVNMGYNVRPMEFQGAFGIHQIKKLEKFIEIRRSNAEYWNKRLEPFDEFIMTHKERKGTRHVWFAYPITVNANAPFKKKDLINHLESNGIETRPIEASDITQQPVMELIDHRIGGSLNNSRFVHENSFFIGNHQAIGKEEREYVGDVLEEFLSKRR